MCSILSLLPAPSLLPPPAHPGTHQAVSPGATGHFPPQLDPSNVSHLAPSRSQPQSPHSAIPSPCQGAPALLPWGSEEGQQLLPSTRMSHPGARVTMLAQRDLSCPVGPLQAKPGESTGRVVKGALSAPRDRHGQAGAGVPRGGGLPRSSTLAALCTPSAPQGEGKYLLTQACRLDGSAPVWTEPGSEQEPDSGDHLPLLSPQRVLTGA